MKNRMYPLLILLMLFFSNQMVLAQNSEPLLVATLAEDFRVTVVTADASRVVLPAGSEVTIVRYRKSPTTYRPELFIKVNETPYFANQNLMKAVGMDVANHTLEDIWTYAFLKSDALKSSLQPEDEKDSRLELEREYDNFQSQIDIYQDEFLEDYLHKLAFELFPGGFVSTFPATLRLRVYSGLEPASFATSNGEVFLSTGLLSTLRSEEELKAIICLELAHLYLDHPFQNYKSMLRSQRRAEFWAGVATIGAAALEVAAYNTAYNRGTLTPFDLAFVGNFTSATAFLSFGLASTISTRLGLDYTNSQKEEALQLAELVFEKMGHDKAIFTALYGRINDYYDLQASHRMIHARYNRYDHAYTPEKLMAVQQSDLYTRPSSRFMTLMQSVNLSTAFGEFNDRNFKYVEHLVQTEISYGNAIINYYILNAMVQRRKPNNADGMSEALRQLHTKMDDASYLPLDVYREIALLNIRLDNLSDALDALLKYRDMVIENPQIVTDANTLRWVDQMIQILEADVKQG